MTTKPKAKKFRIRRSPSAAETGAAPHSAAAPSNPASQLAAQRAAAAPQQTGQPSGQEQPARQPRHAPADPASAQTAAQASPPPGAQPRASATPRRPAEPTSRSGQVSSARETSVEAEIDAIRREGLTGRQLRMARRVAHKHNLAATSDFDAVRLLRKKGIDPFQRSNMLELVVSKNNGEDQKPDPADAAKVQLPQTITPKKQTLPATELSPAQQRERDISEIQRDLTRRRRRKLALLLSRLFFFVMLPTIAAGYYFYVVATPMYATNSAFLIIKNESAGSSGFGGLLSGTQFATTQDSITVQDYLTSKEAMLRLDDDAGFRTHFQQDWIDPIQRLPAPTTNEEAYKTYSKNVKIGYDPTEGVIRLEVSAANPEVSAEFSRRLISYAEERVNQLSEQKREDQMKEARSAFEEAAQARRDAQQALVELQIKGALLDPEGVISSLRGRINQVEVQLQDKELQLAALLDNARPNKAKVQGAQGDIARLKALLDDLNAQMVDASKGENSLAQLAVRIQMAQADIASRDMMLQSALQQMETTRLEANKQVRYLTTSVKPVASEEPSYPRKFENTILAFLIFSGIYLMFSLTASILREQVSS
ncbi:MAG: capsule biosynthesis protein [Rhodobacteraceae bacterium]|nr:capsule biosynthesis protein [Paracoccaceae bacterium]